jgi:hypothetical protein
LPPDLLTPQINSLLILPDNFKTKAPVKVLYRVCFKALKLNRCARVFSISYYIFIFALSAKYAALSSRFQA